MYPTATKTFESITVTQAIELNNPPSSLSLTRDSKRPQNLVTSSGWNDAETFAIEQCLLETPSVSTYNLYCSIEEGPMSEMEKSIKTQSQSSTFVLTIRTACQTIVGGQGLTQ